MKEKAEFDKAETKARMAKVREAISKTINEQEEEENYLKQFDSQVIVKRKKKGNDDDYDDEMILK